MFSGTANSPSEVFVAVSNFDSVRGCSGIVVTGSDFVQPTPTNNATPSSVGITNLSSLITVFPKMIQKNRFPDEGFLTNL
jgi:hypothetical protein